MNGAFLDKMTRLDCRLLFDCMTIKIEKRRKRRVKMNPTDKLMDKYHLSLHESQFLLKNNLVTWIYQAGKFENLKATPLQIKQIIKYNWAKDVAVDEVLTIVHLKRGFEYLLKATDEPLLEKAKKK